MNIKTLNEPTFRNTLFKDLILNQIQIAFNIIFPTNGFFNGCILWNNIGDTISPKIEISIAY